MKRWLVLAGAVMLAACDQTTAVAPDVSVTPQFESLALLEGLTGQSPIDIAPANAVRDGGRLPKLRFDYSPLADLHVVNTGSPEEEATIRANVLPGGGEFYMGEKRFTLLQFHWHTPSEHTVNGEYFPLEMHLVHGSDDGELTVVGVLIQHGAFNRALAQIFDDLPEDEEQERDLHRFNLVRLAAGTGSTFRYSGSLTTPPFTEGVNWVVMTEPIEMSRDQIRNFTTLFPEGNSRLAQPLDGRIVVTDLPPGHRK